jgi:hypothetical protein
MRDYDYSKANDVNPELCMTKNHLNCDKQHCKEYDFIGGKYYYCPVIMEVLK